VRPERAVPRIPGPWDATADKQEPWRMHVHRSQVELVVQAPAKLNLFFEVLAKRADGYHEIETLMCPVGLYDTLLFREGPEEQLELTCQRVHGAGGPTGQKGELDLPEGRENLVLRAVELLRQQAGIRRGASLRLIKRIPIAAGLGGGSSDAAAALVAANQAWGLAYSRGELAQFGARLGSDVPFFLSRGPAVCRGRGERVEEVPAVVGLHFVVVHPPEGLSTAAVYDRCRPGREPRTLAPMLEAIQQGDISRIGRLLFNRLRPAAESLSPWIQRLQREFAGQDCPGHGMSGSGTSYFGLCRHARHARRAARRLQANGVGSVFTVRSCR
jgi:4-diphosphocytidyl-2-C-methyl-D-erythritol kinase